MPLTHLLTPFTPMARRHEVPHGQGVITYDQSNALHGQVQPIHAAPDPIRQGDTPSRPPRHQIAIMSTRLDDWGMGMQEDFLVAPGSVHSLTRRIMPAGRQLDVRSQQPVGVRPNLAKPPAVTYGSLFELGPDTYDIA